MKGTVPSREIVGGVVGLGSVGELEQASDLNVILEKDCSHL
jgi:hypothetical protein